MNSKTANKQTALAETLHADFEMLAAMDGNAPGYVKEARTAAMENFGTLGWPTTRHEEWKYTSLRKLEQREYAKSYFPSPAPDDAAWLDDCRAIAPDAHLVVLVNGHFDAERSDPGDASIQIESLAVAWSERSDLLDLHYDMQVRHAGHAPALLNTALVRDGVFIRIPKGKTAAKPVLVIHLNDTTAGDRSAYARTCIVAEKNSEAKIIEKWINVGGNHNFENHVTEAFCDEDARLKVISLQDDTDKSSLLNFTEVRQQARSVFSSLVLTTGGEIVRNDLRARHHGERCETQLHGLYLLDGRQHADNHTLVDHRLPNCYSNELYKGVLDGNATAVFNGKVFVRQDAQKTNAFQSNKTILLSDGATINTKPQLEIFADDVKCSHGATTGRLDEEALFYLRSRGIAERQARALLTYAFASEIAEQIAVDSVKQYFEERVRERLFTGPGQ